MITEFQKKVYSIVKEIPRGKTKSYGDIAKKLNTSPRAVGQALKKNYNTSVPCHRVIHSNGEIGDYNKGKKNKIKLLKEEGAI